MYVYMGDTQGELSNSQGGLEFRLKFHPHREKGEEYGPLRGE